MYSYKKYLDNEYSITIDECEKIYEEIVNCSDWLNEDIKDVWKELIENIYEYVNYRQQWFLKSREERMDMDKSRSIVHDSMIIKFNMLARCMKMNNMNSNWRDILGEDRRRIGDFACYVMFVYGINAR